MTDTINTGGLFPPFALATLQTLYDGFHADMEYEKSVAESCSFPPDALVHWARVNAYTNARDAVMRAAFYTLEPAQ